MRSIDRGGALLSMRGTLIIAVIAFAIGVLLTAWYVADEDAALAGNLQVPEALSNGAANSMERDDAVRNEAVTDRTPQVTEIGQSIRAIQASHPELYAYIVQDQESALLTALLKELSYLDPRAAARMIEQQEAGEFRDRLFYQFAETWRKSDPIASLSWLKTQAAFVNTATYRSELYETMVAVAKLNPDTAMANLDLLNNPGEQEAVIASMAEGWMAVSTDAAFEWLERLDEQGASNHLIKSAYGNIMSLYAQTKPKEAAAVIESIEDAALRWDLTAPLIDGFASDDMEGALDWVLISKHDESRAYGLMLITERGAIETERLLDVLKDDPALLDADSHQVLLSVVVGHAAREDPQMLMGRVGQFPSQLQASVIRQTVADWYQSDEAQTMEWLSRSARGEHYDIAAKQIASDMLAKDAFAALDLAQTIQSADQRFEALTAILSSSREAELTRLVDAVDFTYLSDEQHLALAGILESKQLMSPLVLP